MRIKLHSLNSHFTSLVFAQSIFHTIYRILRVGNWSGVTVEKKVGKLKDKQGTLIDLPGVYDLNPVSRDEGVVTNFLLTEEFQHIDRKSVV